MIIILYVLGVEPGALMEGSMFQYIDSFHLTYNKEEKKEKGKKIK